MKNIITFISLFLLPVFLTSVNAGLVENEIIDYKEITLGCLILGRDIAGEHVINNNVDCQNLLLIARAPVPDCINHELPAIDFTKHTLISYISSIAGCQSPEVTKQITKINNNYRMNINIVQQGWCERLNHIVFWGLIPKVDDSANVQFTIVKK